jgi:hypothetical protein
MIRLSQSEQVVWDAFFMAVTKQILHMNDGPSAEYIAERAAEMADEMLLERRERSVERRAAPLDWLGPA